MLLYGMCTSYVKGLSDPCVCVVYERKVEGEKFCRFCDFIMTVTF